MRIAITHTRLRVEERLLLDAFEAEGIRPDLIDLREVVFDPADTGPWTEYDAVVDRSVSLTACQTAVRIIESFGVRCVNSARSIAACSDKLATTIALEQAGIPQPGVRVAVGEASGVEAVESLGYPAVLKPTVGSWGRLVSRVNDRDAAEAIIEHRSTLGSAQHGVFYAQQHIDKPGRDLRVFVVGGRAIAGIARSSEHWLTNTARGASAKGIEVTGDLGDLCERAVRAVGADIAAVDVLECPRQGYLVNELNHSMEFRNSIDTTGVDIPGFVARHVIEIAAHARDQAEVSA